MQINLCLLYTFPSYSITIRTADVQNFIHVLPSKDWEPGLREAAYQALLRERYDHENLREHLFAAPIIGRQDTSSPFGDIAILARGQLYATREGFQFVQDVENHCNNCKRQWKPYGHERLLALWTVKRLRHRDNYRGHRYEMEYTISPMSAAIREDFVTRNGGFDYGVPGHVFIVKTDPPIQNVGHNYRETFIDKYPRAFDAQRTTQWYTNRDPLREHPPIQYLPPPRVNNYETVQYSTSPNQIYRPGILIGISPNGYKHYIHDIPELPPNVDLKHYDLYKNLIETLARKASTTQYSTSVILTPPQNFVNPKTKATTQQNHVTLIPIDQTTFAPISVGFLFPLTTELQHRKPQTTTETFIKPIKTTTSYQPTTVLTQTPQTTTYKVQTQMHFFIPTEGEEDITQATKTSTTSTQNKSEEVIDIFPEPKIENKYPDSINAQLSPPNKDMEVTSYETPTGQSSASHDTSTSIPFPKIAMKLMSTRKLNTPTTTLSPNTITERQTNIKTMAKPTPTNEIKTVKSISITTNYYVAEEDTTETETQSQYIPTTLKITTTTNQTIPPIQIPTTTKRSFRKPTKTTTELVESTSIGTDSQSTSLFSTVSAPSTSMHISTETALLNKETSTSALLQPTSEPAIRIKPTRSKVQTFTIEETDINIFGDEITATEKNKKPQLTVVPKHFNTKDIDDIFGNTQTKQTLNETSTIVNTPKIIYSNFFEASTITQLPTTILEETSTETTLQTYKTDSTQQESSTSQSILTSISYEINKRNKTKTHSTTVKAKMYEVVQNDKNIKIFRAEMPESNEVSVSNTTTKEEVTSNSKIFDDLALSLINHARSIDILDGKQKDSKLKRKIYVPKGKYIRQKN